MIVKNSVYLLSRIYTILRDRDKSRPYDFMFLY